MHPHLEHRGERKTIHRRGVASHLRRWRWAGVGIRRARSKSGTAYRSSGIVIFVPSRRLYSPIRATIDYLKQCQAARAQGFRVSCTTDPAWLVDVAINRRAGWPDDPSHSRGSAMPTPDGRFPPRAGGDSYRHLRQLANHINTPRLIVRGGELGEHQWLRDRLPHRFED